jgi:hypothetical protein
VRLPGDGGAAFASESASAARRRNQGIDLVQPLVESNEIAATLGHELDPEAVAAEHLEDEASEIAKPLFTFAKERAPLALERGGVGRPHRRLALGGAPAPASAERPQTCHQSPNVAVPPGWSQARRT